MLPISRCTLGALLARIPDISSKLYYHTFPLSALMGDSKKNVVVIGGSYTGAKLVDLIAPQIHLTHNTILIEPHTHFQHLFAFPRVSVVKGFEYKAFVPFTNAFHECPPGSTARVRARATEIHPGKVLLDRGEPPVAYDYLVYAAGTRLSPPGTLDTESKDEGRDYFQRHAEMIAKANNIVIIGGGAIGVQMATDIQDHYDSAKNVTLVHSREQLMNRFHPRLHEIVVDRAKEMKIKLVLGHRVKLPEGGTYPNDGSTFDVELVDGTKLSGDLAIVCTGMTPLSEPMRTLSPSSINPITGFVRVHPTHQIIDPNFPKVFAIGDVADSGAPKSAAPGRLQAAVVANNIARMIVHDEKRRRNEPVNEVKLETFTPGPAGINLSLGIHHKVLFRNPPLGEPNGEPTVDIEDKGTLDVRCSMIWRLRAPGVPMDKWDQV